MPTAHQELIQQILAQAKNTAIAAAMLVGSSAESNQNPYEGPVPDVGGTESGGAFMFNSAVYPTYLWHASPAAQVSAILPSYEGAFQEAEQQGLVNAQGQPQGISEPALAEWIALHAERPADYLSDAQQIVATGQPYRYGPPESQYYVQNWQSQIVPELQGKDVLTSAEVAGGPVSSTGPFYSSGSSTDIFTQAMIKLNEVMNPTQTSSGVLGILGLNFIAPIDQILSRGLFALGFGIVAIAEFITLGSGGRITGRDIPGLVAAFVAGPEAGMANVASKLGIKGVSRSQPTELSEQRLSLAREREQRVAQSQELNRQLAERRLQESIRRSSATQQRLQASQVAKSQQAQSRQQLAETRARVAATRESRLQSRAPLEQYRAQTARRRTNLAVRRQRYLERLAREMEPEDTEES